MARDFSRMSESELRDLDALLAPHGSRWWDSHYQDRAKPCPFFGTAADESLAMWIQAGLLRPGLAIDLGCGNARNAIFLARQGFTVQAVDYSHTAIEWARDRIADAGVAVSLRQANVLELDLAAGHYDLVYDSGCFHHIAPHRRSHYVTRVVSALKPGGCFGLACFRPEGGSGYGDDEVYSRGSLGGGLGYTESQLRKLWSRGLQIRALRPMDKPSVDSGLFGESYLWALLAQKDSSPTAPMQKDVA